MYSYTCAHKTLPFNTILKITNRANGKSVQVRVNDRGPFVYNREVDLSKAAAVKLGMIGSGTARCDIVILKLGPNTKASRQTAAKSAEIMRQRGQVRGGSSGGKAVKHGAPVKDKVYNAGTFWDVQVASFSSRDNANKFAQGLLKKGFKNVVLQRTGSVYRVVIKNVEAKYVNSLEKKLNEMGYENILIRERLK